jgi:hypothetical protein
MRFDPATVPTRLNPDLSPELEREVSFFLARCRRRLADVAGHSEAEIHTDTELVTICPSLKPPENVRVC